MSLHTKYDEPVFFPDSLFWFCFCCYKEIAYRWQNNRTRPLSRRNSTKKHQQTLDIQLKQIENKRKLALEIREHRCIPISFSIKPSCKMVCIYFKTNSFELGSIGEFYVIAMIDLANGRHHIRNLYAWLTNCEYTGAWLEAAFSLQNRIPRKITSFKMLRHLNDEACYQSSICASFSLVSKTTKTDYGSIISTHSLSCAW